MIGVGQVKIQTEKQGRHGKGFENKTSENAEPVFQYSGINNVLSFSTSDRTLRPKL